MREWSIFEWEKNEDLSILKLIVFLTPEIFNNILEILLLDKLILFKFKGLSFIFITLSNNKKWWLVFKTLLKLMPIRNKFNNNITTTQKPIFFTNPSLPTTAITSIFNSEKMESTRKQNISKATSSKNSEEKLQRSQMSNPQSAISGFCCCWIKLKELC